MIIEVIPSKNGESFSAGSQLGARRTGHLTTWRHGKNHGAKHVGKWGKTWESTAKLWIQNSFCIFFGSGFGIFFGFLSWYHVPCICNSLELESVILHGICYILAWSLCILHGICYIWPCSPSILHGICHVLALQPLICMVFATFRYFKRSYGFLRVSLGFHLVFHL